jgi:hypothetical protein
MHLTRSLIVVDRSRARMVVYSAGKRVWSAPVGIGLPGTPTPAGHFWISERFKISDPSADSSPVAPVTPDRPARTRSREVRSLAS